MLDEFGKIMTINLDRDISQELNMLRGIEYARRNPDLDLKAYCEAKAKITVNSYKNKKTTAL